MDNMQASRSARSCSTPLAPTTEADGDGGGVAVAAVAVALSTISAVAVAATQGTWATPNRLARLRFDASNASASVGAAIAILVSTSLTATVVSSVTGLNTVASAAAAAATTTTGSPLGWLPSASLASECVWSRVFFCLFRALRSRRRAFLSCR